MVHNSYFFQTEWQFLSIKNIIVRIYCYTVLSAHTHWIEECDWKRNQLKYEAQHETDSDLNPNKPNFFLFEREGILESCFSLCYSDWGGI